MTRDRLEPKKYFGKYRGRVFNNIDPLFAGRVQVEVISVLGDAKPWAMPCVPYVKADEAFKVIPPVGTPIWVEFEGGDVDYPIWVGCFWRFDDEEKVIISP